MQSVTKTKEIALQRAALPCSRILNFIFYVGKTYTWRLRLKGYLFLRVQVYGRAGFSQVEVHASVGKSVILICKMTFVAHLYSLKRGLYCTVKRDPQFETRYVEGVIFVNERYTKSEPSLPKILYKKGKGLDLAGEPPCIKLC